jgi:hypothetical protein
MQEEPLPSARVWAKRVGWLALIWAVSVATLGLVALLIRAGMHAAGMSS